MQAAGFTPMLPSWIPEGYELDSVEVFPDSFTSSMTIRYMKGDEDYLIISVMHMWHTDGAVQTGIDMKDAELGQYWRNGILYTTAIRTDSSITINWNIGNEIYEVDCIKQPLEVVQDIVRSFKQ